MSRTEAFLTFAAALATKGLTNEMLTLRVPTDEWFEWCREANEMKSLGIARTSNPLFEVLEMYGPAGLRLRVESAK